MISFPDRYESTICNILRNYIRNINSQLIYNSIAPSSSTINLNTIDDTLNNNNCMDLNIIRNLGSVESQIQKYIELEFNMFPRSCCRMEEIIEMHDRKQATHEDRMIVLCTI